MIQAEYLKIIEKSHSIVRAERATFTCTLSKQKFIKNAKNSQFGEFMKLKFAVKQRYQTSQFSL